MLRKGAMGNFNFNRMTSEYSPIKRKMGTEEEHFATWPTEAWPPHIIAFSSISVEKMVKRTFTSPIMPYRI